MFCSECTFWLKRKLCHFVQSGCSNKKQFNHYMQICADKNDVELGMEMWEKFVEMIFQNHLKKNWNQIQKFHEKWCERKHFKTKEGNILKKNLKCNGWNNIQWCIFDNPFVKGNNSIYFFKFYFLFNFK